MLDHLYIAPNAQGLGVGSWVMGRVLEDAAERNALLIPAHFGGVHCCRVRRRGDAFEPVFEAP